MTLQNRLLLSFALVAAVTAVSIALAFNLISAREVRTFMMAGEMVELGELKSQLETYYQDNGGWTGVDALLPRRGQGMGAMMGGMMGGQRVRIADANGVVVANTRSETGATLSFLERLDAITLVDANGARVGYLVAEAAGGMGSSSGQLVARLTNASLIGVAVGLALALAAAWVLSNRLLKPIANLNTAAASLARGDLSERVKIDSKDEIAGLGQSFNQMAESLQRYEHNRQAMTADIAHELRTPIAIQRAHLEALQDGVYPLTAENLQPILDQTELLIRLVDDLRTLALAEAGGLSLEYQDTDLSGLLVSALERFAPDAENRQIALVLDNPAGAVQVKLDARRIEQILNNLISNALRHTPPGGQVMLRMEKAFGTVRIFVIDSGEGIPPDILPHIFERFYRGDRSRGRQEGGTGLGLSIARQLALAHQG
ncbi:MAG: HAMP domain-containing protein, partial [Anaerolineae bacterium]|nr:HAMP domain-containing protein [Anaerolineae bacterium]